MFIVDGMRRRRRRRRRRVHGCEYVGPPPSRSTSLRRPHTHHRSPYFPLLSSGPSLSPEKQKRHAMIVILLFLFFSPSSLLFKVVVRTGAGGQTNYYKFLREMSTSLQNKNNNNNNEQPRLLISNAGADPPPPQDQPYNINKPEASSYHPRRWSSSSSCSPGPIDSSRGYPKRSPLPPSIRIPATWHRRIVTSRPSTRAAEEAGGRKSRCRYCEMDRSIRTCI